MTTLSDSAHKNPTEEKTWSLLSLPPLPLDSATGHTGTANEQDHERVSTLADGHKTGAGEVVVEPVRENPITTIETFIEESHMLKLNVGLNRKVGEANYGSRGASVNLEIEVESGIVREPDKLQSKIDWLFSLAKASVDAQLAGGDCDQAAGSVASRANGSHSNGNGSSCSNGRRATASQVRAIHAIANRQRLDLTGELRQRFSVDRPDDLGIGEASEFIDAIKTATNGSGGRR